jgi:large subunit ribosomal protein L15
MPLQRRVPKFGFNPLSRVEYRAINIETLQLLADSQKIEKITPEVLINAGLISRKHLVKILGRGTLSAKLEVEAHAFSKAAEQAISSAGGTAVKL